MVLPLNIYIDTGVTLVTLLKNSLKTHPVLVPFTIVQGCTHS